MEFPKRYRLRRVSICQLLYGTCVVLTGLIAGLFYGWQCSVINGLALLPDREYLMAFQSMNKGILNLAFFLSFMGSIMVLAITAFISYKRDNSAFFPYLAASLAIYMIGVFGVTVACNVPLNETLAAFDISGASGDQIKGMRLRFENLWNSWHLVRTIACMISFVILTIPLLRKLHL